MSVKVKRLIALGVCVALLGVAVFQNVRMNNKDKLTPKPTQTANSQSKEDSVVNSDEFFAQARLEKESNRAEEEALCAAVIADSQSTEEEISEANGISSVLTEEEI